MNAYLFDNIRASFLATGFSSEIFYLILIIIAVLVLLGAGYTISLVLKKNKKEPKISTITDPQIIKEVLIECMAKRSKFEVMFELNGQHKESIHCTLMDVTKDRIVLDMPFTLNENLDLTKKNVTCYFYLPTKKDFFIFYNFASRTISQQKREGQLTQLGIALPETIEIGQKRNFLRVQAPTPSTPLSAISILRLWPAQFNHDQLQDNVKTWKKPLVFPEKEMVWAENISQGGMRIIIEKGQPYEEKLKACPQIFVYFSMKKHNENKKIRYMVNCRVRSLKLDKETGLLTLGLQFLHQAKKGASPELVTWETVTAEEGIGTIGDWAFLFHIYEHRSNSALN